MNRLLPIGVLIFLLTACATAPDCDPNSAFNAGRNDIAADSACDQPAYGEAWRLGQTLGELEREQAALEDSDQPLTTAQRARLRSLARDIPELETLARIQGLLPPADISQQDP